MIWIISTEIKIRIEIHTTQYKKRNSPRCSSDPGLFQKAIVSRQTELSDFPTDFPSSGPIESWTWTDIYAQLLLYESMSPSATLGVEVESPHISSCPLYDIVYGEDVIMPMDAVKDELVQRSWKIDSPLVKVR